MIIGTSYALDPSLYGPELAWWISMVGYGSAINVCDWLRGLHLLRRSCPNEFCFSSAVKALGQDGTGAWRCSFQETSNDGWKQTQRIGGIQKWMVFKA